MTPGEPREAARTMRAIGHRVPVLPVRQHFQRPGGVAGAPGERDRQQQVDLGQGERGSLFPPTGTEAA